MMFLRSLQNQSHYCHKRIGPQDSGSASYVIQQGYPLPSASLVGAVSIGCPGPTKQEAPTNASQIENRHDVGLSYPNAEHRQVAQTLFWGNRGCCNESASLFLLKPFLWNGVEIRCHLGTQKRRIRPPFPIRFPRWSEGPRQCCSQQSSGSRQQPCG